MTLSQRFDARMKALMPAPLPPRIGVAVSGGGDSMALMHLAAHWAGAAGLHAEVASVDHGLRAAAAEEAAMVAWAARGLGLLHETLRWRGSEAQGNLQDAARRARYGLLAAWAARRRLDTVLLGHTRDDNVECLVLGLARGAGLDGLSGMRPAFRRDGARFLRPLLEESRADLRDWLTGRGIDWVEDPSNEDPRFARVRVRQALELLAPLGVTPEALARSVENLRSTREGLDALLRAFIRDHCRIAAGDVLVAPDAFASLPDDLARRFLNAALRWVSGAEYTPRAGKLANVLSDDGALRAGLTLHGCILRTGGHGLRISREPEAAARAAPVAPGARWDGRWMVSGPFEPGMEVRCLGPHGILQRPDWREARLPRVTCLSGPAVWSGERLVAAPLIEPDCAFAAEVATGFADSL
ncbi:tRNA lysidine(34) synthetase TilS [Tropicimonas sediminicola]|uniref:tRNA(Ile)-lysidine synthase n=1 Tax=Tropicimonas sediminicola TaxID=1031541 RepID=A0A239LVZ9_9RHOB|nr:tRNA lysidine(34) synthetase TilS [Tropicimonas sediminicola]SNT34132.1 tRNA(Ile)-lysidine synthase [Tropicimonas sediminicola]